MRLTDEMIQEDDKRFKRQDLLAEFNYCGKEVPKRMSITNDDIRFYAWTLLKEQEETRKFYAEKCDELYAVAKSRTDVVRCKDCVFRDPRDGMCEHVLQVRNPDWYCADGERR